MSGGRPTLDLYNAHFWNWQERQDGFGPCQERANFWNLDKPLVYAELPAHIHSHVDRYAAELTECALRNGFAGVLFWAYNDPGYKLLDAIDVVANATRRLGSGVASFEAVVAWLQGKSPPGLSSAALGDEGMEQVARARSELPNGKAAQQPPACHGWCIADGVNLDRHCKNSKCAACTMCGSVQK